MVPGSCAVLSFPRIATERLACIKIVIPTMVAAVLKHWNFLDHSERTWRRRHQAIAILLLQSLATLLPDFETALRSVVDRRPSRFHVILQPARRCDALLVAERGTLH
jgi:hypothetical protein